MKLVMASSSWKRKAHRGPRRPDTRRSMLASIDSQEPIPALDDIAFTPVNRPRRAVRQSSNALRNPRLRRSRSSESSCRFVRRGRAVGTGGGSMTTGGGCRSHDRRGLRLESKRVALGRRERCRFDFAAGRASRLSPVPSMPAPPRCCGGLMDWTVELRVAGRLRTSTLVDQHRHQTAPRPARRSDLLGVFPLIRRQPLKYVASSNVTPSSTVLARLLLAASPSR